VLRAVYGHLHGKDMTTPNPEHVKRLIKVINSAPYFQLLSMKMLEIGIGYSATEINLTDKHLNPFGGAHGGVFSSIIDSAASWALFYGVEDENAGLASVNLNLNYLSPIKEGKLIAEGRQIKLGKTLGYALCNVNDAAGKLLAHGTLTVMIMPGKAPAVGPPSIKKFVD
jgi:uncharacterized protein (TIGR00369 family)